MSRKSITNLVVTHGEAGLTQYGRVFSEEDEANYEQSIRAAEIARRNEARAKGIRFKPRLYRFEELPAFLRDNEFIRSGYRVFYSYADNWASMLMIHNETGNIWTHFLGFLWCLGLMISQYRY